MLATTRLARDPLSQIFLALADPTRRAILSRLSRGVATVTEIAVDVGSAMTLPAVTKHLKVLERAQLVRKTRDAQFRRCQIDGAALRDVVHWLEPYRAHWEERFDRLDAYLKRTAPSPAPLHPTKKRKDPPPHGHKKAK